MGDRPAEPDADEGVVVANSTPLINLAAIERLDLLSSLFGEIVVPEDVWSELRAGEATHPTFRAVDRWGGAKRATLSDRALYTSLTEHLDDGEAAAITLAVERKARLLILDEREARAAAQRLGCRVLGTVGVIAAAKTRGLIPLAAPLIRQIIDKARFHIAPDLVRRVLQDIGEE